MKVIYTEHNCNCIYFALTALLVLVCAHLHYQRRVTLKNIAVLAILELLPTVNVSAFIYTYNMHTNFIA